jgi:threonine dehydrogenase-like Zn-dependent dehydrogenase
VQGESVMPKELQLSSPRQVRIIAYDDAPLQPGEVRAQAVLSGISHGTELNLYRGTAPFRTKRFDRDLRLFLEAGEEAMYPAKLGYEWVGRVTDVGPDVTGFAVGDLVHLPFPHRETYTFRPDEPTWFGRPEPLPPGLDPDRAIVLALAGVALQAVHDAQIKLGDRVAIFGMGVIGLLAVQLARLDGALWIDAVDPLPGRRALAEQFGADRALDPAAGDVALAIKTASPQRGADVAIELSGNDTALHEAIRSVRMAGTVVAGGFYQDGRVGLPAPRLSHLGSRTDSCHGDAPAGGGKAPRGRPDHAPHPVRAGAGSLRIDRPAPAGRGESGADVLSECVNAFSTRASRLSLRPRRALR